MPTKIDVVHVLDTKHVVGAVARRGAGASFPSPADKLAALVGTQLVIAPDPGSIEFVLRTDWLDAAEVDFESSVGDVLLRPREWFLDDANALTRASRSLLAFVWNTDRFQLTFDPASIPSDGAKILILVTAGTSTTLVEHAYALGQNLYATGPITAPAAAIALVAEGFAAATATTP